MSKSLGLLLLVGLFLTGCTYVNAGNALEDLDSSRSKVDRQVFGLANELSAALGGSPTIDQRRYGVCGSAPVEALEYNASVEFEPTKDVSVDAVRDEVIAAGWKVTGSSPAQGVSPHILFARRGERRIDVGVKKGEISVIGKGDCIRVTSEQANNLKPPKN